MLMTKSIEKSTPRYGRRFALLGLLFAVVFLLSFVMGRYSVPLGTTLRILWSRLAALCTFGRAVAAQTWTETEASVVLNIRLPRILCEIGRASCRERVFLTV